jgi:hypothetical protein
MITNSDGRQVPVRYIGEQHVQEDLGWIPTASDWLRKIKPEKWMFVTGTEKTKQPLLWKEADEHGKQEEGQEEEAGCGSLPEKSAAEQN